MNTDYLTRMTPRCRLFLLDGKKFRTNLLVFFFDLPLQRETATQTALLAELLKHGSENYPTPQALAKRAEELFGALWDVSVVKKGDRQLLLFSLEVLKAVEFQDAVDFLRELLLHPLLEGGAFPVVAVARQKQILRRRLEGLQDDKKAFARKRALEETAEGTAWAISADGYAEDLDAIDGRGLYAFYRKLLEEAHACVFFCGDRAEKSKLTALRRDFAGNLPWSARTEQDFEKQEPPRFILEHMDAEQTRLVMGFCGDIRTAKRQAALAILHQLLGGDPDSMLFREMREKEGLCYDVKSYLYPLSPYLFVQAGIEEKNARKAGKLVLRCLEERREKPATAKELRRAKEALARQLEGLADQPWAMVDFFTEQVLQERPLSAEKFLRDMERVDAEDVQAAAAHLELAAVYLCSGRGQDDGEID